MFKAYILYVVMVWLVPPLMTENQKTLVFQFDSEKECKSIVQQVSAQMKSEQGLPFHFRILECVSCSELYDAGKCPKTAPRKK